jgi:hypothetical protein
VDDELDALLEQEIARRELDAEIARRETQPAQPSQFEDIVASGSSGIARGAADLAGLPGTIGDAVNSGGQWLLRNGYEAVTGAAPSPQGGMVERFFAGPTEEVQAAMIGGGANPLSGANLKSGLSAVTGGATDYQPYTTAGDYARTIGEFVPGAAAFGGASAPALIRNALVPAVASEGAGQATEGTGLEPYARIAGALAGGMAANSVGRAAKPALPSAKQIKESAGYKELKPILQEAQVNQPGYQKAVGDLRAVADDFGMVPEQHGAFEAILARHADSASKGGASLQDLEILRRSLLNAGKQPTNPSAGELSRQMIEKLDDFVDEGTGLIGESLKEARQVYRTGAKAAIVEEAVEKAQNTASGFENGLRVEFRKLLNNKRLNRQWTETERSAMQDVVRGDFKSNTLRWLGGFGVPLDNGRNFLGSVMGGGAGAAIGSALAGPVGAAVGGPLLVGVGTAAKAGANAATRNSANIAEALVKGGPQAQSTFAAAQGARQLAGREAVLRALLQSQSATQVPIPMQGAR